MQGRNGEEEKTNTTTVIKRTAHKTFYMFTFCLYILLFLFLPVTVQSTVQMNTKVKTENAERNIVIFNNVNFHLCVS